MTKKELATFRTGATKQMLKEVYALKQKSKMNSTQEKSLLTNMTKMILNLDLDRLPQSITMAGFKAIEDM